MHQVRNYDEWISKVRSLGATKLLQEVTPNSEYNALYAESKANKIVGNWHAPRKVGWYYDPLNLDKARRKFKALPL